MKLEFTLTDALDLIQTIYLNDRKGLAAFAEREDVNLFKTALFLTEFAAQITKDILGDEEDAEGFIGFTAVNHLTGEAMLNPPPFMQAVVCAANGDRETSLAIIAGAPADPEGAARLLIDLMSYIHLIMHRLEAIETEKGKCDCEVTALTIVDGCEYTKTV